MNEIRPSRPGQTPGTRRLSRPSVPVVKRAPPAGPPPRRKAPWIFAGVGAIVVVIAAIAILGGGRKPESDAVVVPPPKKIVTPPAPPPPPTPVEPAVAVSESPPPKDEGRPKKDVVDPLDAQKKALAEAARKHRVEGAALVAEAQKHVDQDLLREKQEEEAFARRFADFRVDARLTTGQVYKQAVVDGFSPDDLKLKTAERGAVNLPWNLVAPETIEAVASHVYRGARTEDLLALARFYVERRMWKESQGVLHRLKKLDDEYERLADDYDEAAGPLLTGKGLFQGAFKTTGASGLRLSYDFSDEAQGDDFWGQEKGFAVQGGKMTLETAKVATWGLGDSELHFWDDLEIEGRIAAEGALLVAFHRKQEGEFYLLEIGNAGTILKKGRTVTGAKEISRNGQAALKSEQKVRIVVRKRRVSVSIADRTALTFDDAAADVETRGTLHVGVSGGRVVVAPGLTISGQVNPDYLRKKIGTVEIAARRSINKDLGEVAELNAKQTADLILGGSREGISADMLLLEFLKVQELPDYDKLKQNLTSSYWNPGDKEKAAKTLDEWLEKYGGFPSLWYLKGVEHLQKGELIEARDKLSKALGLFPDFYEAQYQIAQTWRYEREFEKAYDLAGKALEIRPDYANAHILQAEMRFAIDKKAGAEADRQLRVAEKLNADSQEVLQLRRWVKMQTRGPRDLGCIHEFESKNYRIVTDISPERAAWYADQLEIVRNSYLDLFGKWYRGDARPKPRIAIFNTREAFYTYSELCSTNRHENALGFFDPANNELVLFEDLDLNETLETLYHEAFHHFASAMLKYPPYWWNEGIAEYMSAVRIDPATKSLKERARTLKGRLAYIQVGVRNGFYVRFEKIINYTPGEFYGPMIGVHYAQAWAMLHFFYQHDGGKHRGLIEAYFDALVNGKSQREAFDEVFKGKTDQLEKEWLEYVKTLKPPATP